MIIVTLGLSSTTKYPEEEINCLSIWFFLIKKHFLKGPSANTLLQFSMPMLGWYAHSLTSSMIGALCTLVGWNRVPRQTITVKKKGLRQLLKPTRANRQHWNVLKLHDYYKMRFNEEVLDIKEKTAMSLRNGLQKLVKKQRPDCHLHFLLDNCHVIPTHFRQSMFQTNCTVIHGFCYSIHMGPLSPIPAFDGSSQPQANFKRFPWCFKIQ